MSNCLIYAIKKLFKEGGYLIIRKSRWGMFPHALHAKSIDGIELSEYVPKDPKLKTCPPPLFKGVVRTKFKDSEVDNDSTV